jgi:predicted metalloprotease
MRWTPGGMSDDIEDRRDEGGGGGPRIGGLHIGCGGFLILLVLSLLFRQNFFALLGMLPSDTGGVATSEPSGRTSGGSAPPEEQRRAQFVSFVLDDAQATWAKLLPGRYRPAKLVLFREAVQSGCGTAESAMGPFYCPRDEKAYIDLGFYQDLRSRFGAKGGDFAQAYVLAHEIGHHVQKLSGIEAEVRKGQQERPGRANALSVRLELQADCFAGVWGHAASGRGLLETGDTEEGLNAAAAIGDDRIQQMGGGRVSPEAWTHGSSEQRVDWFRRGLERGDADACDPFAAGAS